MSAPVLYEHNGRVAVATLNRPETRNAITDEAMLADLLEAIDRADRDPEVGALIITGTDPAFCSGGNVKQLAERDRMGGGTPDQVAEWYRWGIQQVPRRLLTTDLVTFAAVNGPAVGAGWDLASMCDIRIASETARFSHPFVNLGIIPGDGGGWLLPSIVGWQRATELTLTGRFIDAAEALAIGAVLEVVPHAEVVTRTRALAEQVTSRPPHATRLAKRLLRHARYSRMDEFLDMSAAFQAIAHHTEDHTEAINAFLEKRPPTYRDR